MTEPTKQLPAGHAEWLAARQRTRDIRAEMLAARIAAKTRRHRERLARVARESTPPKEIR